MPNEYSLRAVDAAGSTKFELPDASLDSVSWVLNEAGQLTFSLDQDDPVVKLIKLKGEHEIQCWINGALKWWGVPWSVDNNMDVASFTCEELLSYFRYRYLTTTSLDYTSIDQHTIAWNLVNYAQTGANMSFGITSGGFPLSGRTRSRKYERDRHEQILELLQEFPTLIDGFDIEIRIFGDGRREFWPVYPRKGIYRPTCAFEYGKNLDNFNVKEDAMNIANQVYATGGSNGAVKFENNYTVPAGSGFYRIYQAIVSEGGELDVNYLLERARAEAEARDDPRQIISVDFNDEVTQILGVIEVGDTTPVKIDRGRAQVAADYRVVMLTWNPEDDSTTAVLNEVA